MWLDEKTSTDDTEMVSLTVRERLAYWMESLGDEAAVRGEVSKREWSCNTNGPNVHEA